MLPVVVEWIFSCGTLQNDKDKKIKSYDKNVSI